MKTGIKIWYLPVIAFTVACSPVFGQKNGHIISESKVEYRPYDSVKGLSDYYDRATYDQVLKSNMKLNRLTYYSDGLKVIAYLAEPANLRNIKYPVIIFNRGSYIRNDIAEVHAPLFNKFTQNNFIVIAPALRQSEGGEGKDEMGGKDLDDIWNVLPILAAKSYVDTGNIFMLGESRGGIMTLELLKENFPVKAAATIGAITDFWAYKDEMKGIENSSRQIWPDYDQNRDSIYYKRSAIKWADRINTPLLIMQGTADWSVNPHHSIDLAEKLNALKKDFQFLLLNGGNHILSGRWTEKRDQEVLDWFTRHMKKAVDK